MNRGIKRHDLQQADTVISKYTSLQTEKHDQSLKVLATPRRGSAVRKLIDWILCKLLAAFPLIRCRNNEQQ